MNIKTNVVKLAVGASVVSAAIAAYASFPSQQAEPVYVMAPFTFVEFEKKDQAVFETANSEYVLEVDFVSNTYHDNYGVAGSSFSEVEVQEIKDIHVYNEDGEVANYYLDNADVQEIVQVIEQELRKPA
ncbi:hypothetical protein F889_02142 [Acinetobacter colistiniresistens]|uniref:Uncharacterized protein n=1 Tax=Acinetobacter colistiniresistens TaxID=280145 RepID=N9R2W1_9GAMM|nr:hypothetical protein [Acinetobacter colistiniresistens]ENX33482.1 hypothetical protein F889_02142 [Acinetobacter colistiniresistens]